MNPIQLLGEWNEGYALDYHTLSSEYLGEDENGYAIYDTKRSTLGQFLYELKYQKKRDKADDIGQIIKPFLIKWDLATKIDYIIPTPSSTKRNFQPVDVICNVISGLLDKEIIEGLLVKSSTSQSKNLDSNQKKELEGSIERKKQFNKNVNILLVDDLFQSGATLNECVKMLRKDKHINKIYVLTITKTRR